MPAAAEQFQFSAILFHCATSFLTRPLEFYVQKVFEITNNLHVKKPYIYWNGFFLGSIIIIGLEYEPGI